MVVDRNRITGGGVTAGLDFAPAPPFDAGTPETAGPELTDMARAGNKAVNDEMAAVAEKLASNGWGRAA
ncbi:hypothetical protein OHA02_11395 [Streptomyces phaeochromogenes]|nr:hypothetical protein [Streptomyces phaeochromogenes]